MVGAPPVADPYIVDTDYMINNNITITSSNVGSIVDIVDMLEFVAHYDVMPINEYYPFE